MEESGWVQTWRVEDAGGGDSQEASQRWRCSDRIHWGRMSQAEQVFSCLGEPGTAAMFAATTGMGLIWAAMLATGMGLQGAGLEAMAWPAFCAVIAGHVVGHAMMRWARRAAAMRFSIVAARWLCLAHARGLAGLDPTRSSSPRGEPLEQLGRRALELSGSEDSFGDGIEAQAAERAGRLADPWDLACYAQEARGAALAIGWGSIACGAGSFFGGQRRKGSLGSGMSSQQAQQLWRESLTLDSILWDRQEIELASEVAAPSKRGARL